MFDIDKCRQRLPLGQFIRYALAGGTATVVQTVVFYALAATCLKCLAGDDWAVRIAGLPAAEIDNGVRAWRYAAATAAGFTVANLFCWYVNRRWVFRPGRHPVLVELGLFFGVSALAMAIATGGSSLAIRMFGMMTTMAMAMQVVAALAINFVLRKFFIFKG